MKRKTFVRAVGLIFLLSSICLMVFCASRLSKMRLSYESSEKGTSLCINEAFVSNFLKYADEDGDYSDWIELYNFGETPLSLDGFYLSDDENQPKKWALPNAVLAPDQYRIIWLSGKDKTAHELHANFSVRAGEALLLSDASGTVLDMLEIPHDADSNTAYGHRAIDTSEAVVLRNATPGKANTSSMSLVIEKKLPPPPAFSHAGGIYNASFLLSLYAEDEKDVIVYTTDGTEPTMASTVYDGAFLVEDPSQNPNRYADQSYAFNASAMYQMNPKPVPKLAIIKAKTVRHGCLSETATQSFYIGDTPAHPILCMNADPEELFGLGGLYAPGIPYYIWKAESRFREVTNADVVDAVTRFFLENKKIKTQISLYAPSGEELLSNNFQASISGQSSKLENKKSFRIETAPRYTGTAIQDAPLFDDSFVQFPFVSPNDSWKSFLIRRIITEDFVSSKLVESSGVAMQNMQPCSLYINGEYWGLYMLTEDLNDTLYYDNHFGIEPQDLILLKNLGNHFYTVHGSLEEERIFEAFIQTVASADVETAYAMADEAFDLPNLATYLAVESILNNGDWMTNNMRVFRANKPDSKWKFALFDLDACLVLTGYGWLRKFQPNISSNETDVPIYHFFKKILQHPTFRQMYEDSCVKFAQHLEENADAIIDTAAAEYEPSWDLDQERWTMVAHPVMKFMGASDHLPQARPWESYKAYIKERVQKVYSLYCPEKLDSNHEANPE